ncbi:hypothetical protein DID77_02825 [Candidatus Marinamargulisbacteria bacterium SCGC AG-439-L15]|nr:hypothetical protein DID77_02825 [Candidatus Marinamargulisbacteria bacterium SCGC AG-439-L15]
MGVNRPLGKRSERGFLLLECLCTLVLMSLFLPGVFSGYITLVKAFSKVHKEILVQLDGYYCRSFLEEDMRGLLGIIRNKESEFRFLTTEGRIISYYIKGHKLQRKKGRSYFNITKELQLDSFSVSMLTNKLLLFEIRYLDRDQYLRFPVLIEGRSDGEV